MFYIKLLAFLVQGFAVGAGPCLFICAPILLPYLAGTKRTWQEGLRATLIFGLTRLMIYSLLGGLVGYVGYYIFKFAFYNRLWGKYIWTFAGAFIVLLGILIILGRGVKNPFCRLLQEHTVESTTRSMVIFGIIFGLSPCLPMLAILTEIMFLAKDFFQGFFYGFAFGIGTVISPLLLLGALAPLIPGKLFKSEPASRIFSLICGILMVIIGVFVVRMRGI